jgi:hypothetical protein
MSNEHDDDSVEVTPESIEDAETIGVIPHEEEGHPEEGDRVVHLHPVSELPPEVKAGLLNALGVEEFSGELAEGGPTPLTAEQQQRVEALHAARFALEKRGTGSVFSGKGDATTSTPPSAADLIRVAKFVIDGDTV